MRMIQRMNHKKAAHNTHIAETVTRPQELKKKKVLP